MIRRSSLQECSNKNDLKFIVLLCAYFLKTVISGPTCVSIYRRLSRCMCSQGVLGSVYPGTHKSDIFPVLIAFAHFDLIVVHSGASISQNRQC